MKKILILALSLSLILTFTACKTRTEENPGTQGEESSAGEKNTAKPASLAEAQKNNQNIDSNFIDLIQFKEYGNNAAYAVIKTNLGELKAVLFSEEAPKAVENFITLADNGFYNGLTIDRGIKNFLIEAGDPSGKGTGGESAFGEPFPNEYSLNLWHFRGALSMSNANPDENGSQFFIVQAPFVSEELAKEMQEAKYPEKVLEQYKETGGLPGFDGKRTVFGMLTSESLSVLDKIAKLDFESTESLSDEDTVIIESITIVKPGGGTSQGSSDASGSEAEGEASKAS